MSCHLPLQNHHRKLPGQAACGHFCLRGRWRLHSPLGSGRQVSVLWDKPSSERSDPPCLSETGRLLWQKKKLWQNRQTHTTYYIILLLLLIRKTWFKNVTVILNCLQILILIIFSLKWFLEQLLKKNNSKFLFDQRHDFYLEKVKTPQFPGVPLRLPSSGGFVPACRPSWRLLHGWGEGLRS